MAFSLGSFAGGFSQGLEEGEDLKRKRLEDQQARVRQKAQADMEAVLRSNGGIQTPNVGGPPAGGGGGGMGQGALPQSVALPGAKPMNAPPNAMGGPAPQGGPAPAPQGPAQPRPPMPQPMGPKPVNTPPQAAPAAQAAPPGPQGAGGQQGQQPIDPSTATPEQLMQQTQQMFKGIAQQLLAANPGKKWDKGELLEATTEMAALATKDADPMVKLTAQYQLAYAKLQLKGAEDATKAGEFEEKLKDTDRNADLRSSTAIKTTEMRDITSEANTGAKDATQVQTTGMRDATSTGNTEARIAAGKGVVKATQGQVAANLKVVDAQIERIKAAMAVLAKQAGSGGNPAADPRYATMQRQLDSALANRAKIAGNAATLKGAGGGGDQGDAGSQYHSADDVVKAYKSGQLTHDAATKILKDNGWAS